MRVKATDVRPGMVVIQHGEFRVSASGNRRWRPRRDRVTLRLTEWPYYDGHVMILRGVDQDGDRATWGRPPEALLRVAVPCRQCAGCWTEHNSRVCHGCRAGEPILQTYPVSG